MSKKYNNLLLMPTYTFNISRFDFAAIHEWGANPFFSHNSHPSATYTLVDSIRVRTYLGGKALGRICAADCKSGRSLYPS